MKKRPWWLLPPGRIHPMWWILLGAATLWFDYVVGLSAAFPVGYSIPVILAAWYSGIWPSLGLAVAVPMLRLLVLMRHTPEPDITTLAFGTLLRGVVVAFVGLWFARLSALERDLDRQVKVLEGLLPICAFCKSIRGEGGRWEPLETYISGRSHAEFSHGVCPSCSAEHYPAFQDTRA
jgi:hypothetical protein